MTVGSNPIVIEANMKSLQQRALELLGEMELEIPDELIELLGALRGTKTHKRQLLVDRLVGMGIYVVVFEHGLADDGSEDIPSPALTFLMRGMFPSHSAMSAGGIDHDPPYAYRRATEVNLWYWEFSEELD